MKTLRILLLFTVWLLVCANALGDSMIILTEEDPPYNFKNAKGEAAGMVTEIVQEIQYRLGNADPIQFFPWARSYLLVQSKPNVVLFSMARTPDRNDQFAWVGPVRYGID